MIELSYKIKKFQKNPKEVLSLKFKIDFLKIIVDIAKDNKWQKPYKILQPSKGKQPHRLFDIAFHYQNRRKNQTKNYFFRSRISYIFPSRSIIS